MTGNYVNKNIKQSFDEFVSMIVKNTKEVTIDLYVMEHQIIKLNMGDKK